MKIRHYQFHFRMISGLASLCMILLLSCSKEMLDEKPNISRVIPSSIRDLQALLDNTTIINGTSGHILMEISTDDYFIDPLQLPLLTNPEQPAAYLWEEDLYGVKEGISDWNDPYNKILYTNVVLERLNALPRTSLNGADWDRIKGSALFIRSWMFYVLSQSFGSIYQEATADKDPGIPMRLQSDITIKTARNTVKQVYDQIEQDLKEAIQLLPEMPEFPTRPSRAAAAILLSRFYLDKSNWNEAIFYASKALSIHSTLTDYNQVNGTVTYPFARYNKEVVFDCNISIAAILSNTRLNVNTSLYNSYDTEDLRKSLWFRTSALGYSYRGSNIGNAAFFTGFATSEAYLNRAESYARMEQNQEALNDLDTLRKYRYTTTGYTPLNRAAITDVFKVVREERRKELVFRGIRWMDLRRWNREPLLQQKLQREVNGVEYSLPPASPRYVFPIPNEVIRLTGMQQNKRS